jgi:hypothetical protein
VTSTYITRDALKPTQAIEGKLKEARRKMQVGKKCSMRHESVAYATIFDIF